MNDVHEKPPSARSLLVLMGSNPEIGKVQHVSQHVCVLLCMCACAPSIRKHACITLHSAEGRGITRRSGLSCLMSTEARHAVLLDLDRSLEAPRERERGKEIE